MRSAPPVSVHVPFPAARRARNKYWNPLHVTMRAVGGLPSFRAQTLFAAFERTVRRTRREDFRIVEFSVQDDHLHLIVEADDKTALSRGMKSFSVRANRLFNAAHRPVLVSPLVRRLDLHSHPRRPTAPNGACADCALAREVAETRLHPSR